MSGADVAHACYSSIADDYLDGQPIRRLMFCYRTVGCAHYLEHGGCTMCAFPRSSTVGEPVAPEQLMAQLDEALARRDFARDGLAELDLFCSGSFFNDGEVPPAARRHAYGQARAMPALRKLLVESRPEYVTRERLREALDLLGPAIRLEVALGLESADRHIRETVIRKGFGREEFEAALSVLAETGAAGLVYVFLKPPGLTERESLDDAVATTRYVFEAGRRHGVFRLTAAVQPAFVQREGPLFARYQQGRYRPPWLWTVVEVLRRVHGLGELQVGTADDTPPPVAVRHNCGRCDAAVEAAITHYNRSQDLAALSGPSCDCQAEWRLEVGPG